MVPFGFRFSPTDEELIQILECKVFNHSRHLDFITETNIYDHEPQHLQWDETVAVNKGEKYYFCRKEQDSREVAGRGWWKATSHVKTIYGGGSGGGVVGYKRPLTFHKFRDGDDGRRRDNPVKTDWIMHEYSLRLDYSSKLQEWRLCKIKYKGGSKSKLISGRLRQISNFEQRRHDGLQQQVTDDHDNYYCNRNDESYSLDHPAGGASSSQHDQLLDSDHHAVVWPLQPAVDQSPPSPPMELFLSPGQYYTGGFVDDDSILDDQQQPLPDLWDWDT